MSDSTEEVFAPEQVQEMERAAEVGQPEVVNDQSEKTAEPETPKPDPVEKRIARLTAKLSYAQQQIVDMSARISASTQQPQGEPVKLDEAEVERRATAKAEERLFNDECNKVASRGEEEFDDFHPKISSLWEEIGGFNKPLVEAALETGDAHKVLYELASDPDEAERIGGLSPARMGAALAKLANKPAPPPVAFSKAPKPIKPVSGSARVEFNEHTATAEQLVEHYSKQAMASRKGAAR